VKKVQRTRWQDSGRENGTGGERMVEEVLRMGRVTLASNPGRWEGELGVQKLGLAPAR
jgi:hypothetical protein